MRERERESAGHNVDKGIMILSTSQQNNHMVKPSCSISRLSEQYSP